MKTAAFFGIAAMGMAAVGAGNAFATPVLKVTVGNQTVNPTETPLGSGTYFFAASTNPVGGFSWGGALVQVNATTNQFTVDLSTVTNGNSGTSNATISFIAEESISDPTAASMQASGSAIATDATYQQTVDFNSSVTSSIPRDSGPLGLNSALMPASPSSAVAYSSVGANLSPSSGELTVINTITLAINPATSLNTSSLVTNISNTSVTTPEPATLALFAVGGLALLTVGRRRKSRI